MKNIVEQLKLGTTITFTAHGNSMSPKIENKEEVTVSPTVDNLVVGDIVLCKVRGRYYLHLIKAVKIVKNKGKRFLIANNKGYDNGWIGISTIYGIKIDARHFIFPRELLILECHLL